MSIFLVVTLAILCGLVLAGAAVSVLALFRACLAVVVRLRIVLSGLGAGVAGCFGDLGPSLLGQSLGACASA